MHDTVWFEIQHIPAVFIASSEFVGAAEAQSKALGMPDVNRVFVPHPIQDATDDEMRERADEVEPGLAGELARELDFLEGAWPDGLPAGVIHADLFPDNVFFRDGRLTGIIDFYFACNDFFAYDLGVCLNAWCFEPDRGFNITKARRLLTAYGKVRDFSADELAALPLLARGSAMRFLATRLFDWLNTPADALVRRKDPLEYLAKLRFHQGVKGAGDYGL